MKLWSYGMVALALAGGALTVLTAACSDSNLGTGAGGDGGASGCPTNPPTIGSACLLASATTCTYPNQAGVPNCECCGTPSYSCQNGKWQELATAAGGAGTGAAPACPATLPEAGSSCTNYGYGGCGAPSQQDCSYNCAQGGTAYAYCSGTAWTISTNGDCSDDGGSDAGDGGDAADGG